MLRALTAIAALTAVTLAMDTLRLFGGQQWLGAVIELETHYFFALAALLMPLVFVHFASGNSLLARCLDAGLALCSAVVLVALGWFANEITDKGWEFGAPPLVTALSWSLWLLTLEAVRRAGGLALFLIVLFFSFMPLVAGSLPAPFAGLASSPSETAAYHALSIESLFGMPFRAFAELVVGFLLFGVALQQTGGGRFFLDLAFAALGKVRGGPAKVAIFASGLMGSMSGSVVTNVVTTGQLTIPAMRGSGMRAEDAAAVEACASTGGVLLPPIMGSTAFVMATFLDVPYYQVALAAALPAALYFLGLFLQIDALAARRGLAGAPSSTLPTLGQTFRDGWYYLIAFAALVFLLLVLQREAVAPYVATAAVLILNQFNARQRFDAAGWIDFFCATGKLLAELLVVLMGVGLIVGALSLTGLSGTLVNDLLYLAGDSVFAMLLLGAVTSFILGIGMTVTAAYIFLAIVLAPALVQSGLEPMAVHLFILYWAMLSFITPPVALGAYAAASVADAKAMQTGFAAMRLGGVIYLVPFLFVINPALIGAGSTLAVLQATVEALLGIWLLSCALQGWLHGAGLLNGLPQRMLIGAAGVAIALPDLQGLLPLAPSNGVMTVVSVGLAGMLWLALRWRARPAPSET
ncbi:MAG: TRAP transporter permease [Pseudomonadales bacterium]